MYEILVPELRDDPAGIGYAEMTDEQRMAAFYADTQTAVVSTRATWRAMLAALGPEITATIKAKIDAAAQTNPAIALAADMLTTYSDGGGLDIGHHYTRAVIDQLVASSVLTEPEGSAIKAMAETKTSRSKILGISPADGHFSSARNMIGGDA